MPVPITWIANFNDNTCIFQIDPNTSLSTSIEKLPRNGLKSIVLVRGAVPILTQHYEPGQRVIYRRRIKQRNDGEILEVCHILGWQKTISRDDSEPEIVQHMMYVFEKSGKIESCSSFKLNHPWFDPIQPVPADLIEVS